MSSGTSRLPIFAALALALAGLVVGGLLVSLGRPGGNVALASPTGSPLSSLPIFVQPTPTATAGPSQPPESFPGLPTPTASQIVVPTDTPFGTPPPSGIPTPTPTNNPTPTPTKKPTPPPTPTPPPSSPPPVLTCAAATGTPTGNVVIGYQKKTPKFSNGWCIDRVDFEFVTGSSFGSVDFVLNGKDVASFTCSYPTACPGPQPHAFVPPKLAKSGAELNYATVCEQIAGNEDRKSVV